MDDEWLVWANPDDLADTGEGQYATVHGTRPKDSEHEVYLRYRVAPHVEDPAEWLKATCARLEVMGYVVVGRHEWEVIIPEFAGAFPSHLRRSPAPERIQQSIAELDRGEGRDAKAERADLREKHFGVEPERTALRIDEAKGDRVVY